MQIMLCSPWSTYVISKTDIAPISFKKVENCHHTKLHPDRLNKLFWSAYLTYLAQVYWTDVLPHHSTEHYERTMNSSSVFDTQYLERKQNIDMWYLYISLFIALFYFWNILSYINHILLFYLLNPRLGKC